MNMIANAFMRAPGEAVGAFDLESALVKDLLKLAGNDSPLAGLSPDEVGGFESGLCALDDATVRFA